MPNASRTSSRHSKPCATATGRAEKSCSAETAEALQGHRCPTDLTRQQQKAKNAAKTGVIRPAKYLATGAVTEVEEAPVKAKVEKKVTPFKESNRFYRGRILDLLRERSYGEKELLQTMKNTYKKSNEEIRRILTGLEKDGLIIKKKSRIQLPE